MKLSEELSVKPLSIPDEGRVLLRGNEALALGKMDDRFTLKFKRAESLIFSNLVKRFEGKSFRLLPSLQLVEVWVEPSQCEGAMQIARSSQDVAFVSHVYLMEKSPDAPLYLTDQLTIQFADRVSPQQMQAIATSLGLQIFKLVSGVSKCFVFQVTSEATANPLKLAQQLIIQPEVSVAEPNIAIALRLCHRPRDPGYRQQWYLHPTRSNPLAVDPHIAVEAAWDITQGDRSIAVAVLDEAIDWDHADFAAEGKIVAPQAATQRQNSAGEKQRLHHGTACARIAVAEENGMGMVGVAPGCALMPIEIANLLDDQSVEAQFEWAGQQGAAVIFCGWTAQAVYFPLSLRQRVAIARAATQGREARGCVIVFAAGNDSLSLVQDALNGFALHPDVIVVGASDRLNHKAAYSNWGGVTLVAPSGDAEDIVQGTSGAGAIVAGVAALMLSANPALTSQNVKRLLQQTADKILPDPQLSPGYDVTGQSAWFGAGKINALKAVQAAKAAFPRSLVAQWLRFENSQSIDIPDADSQGALCSITVEDDRSVLEIEVSVKTEHSFASDLEIYLLRQGITVLLQSRSLGKMGEISKTYSIETTPLLKKLLGRGAGQWQLWVVDTVPCHTGRLLSWTLSLGV